MNHVVSESCWWAPTFGNGQCRLCWNAKNPSTQRSQPPAVSYAPQPSTPAPPPWSVRPPAVEPLPRSLPCIHLGNQRSHGSPEHVCLFDGHDYDFALPNAHLCSARRQRGDVQSCLDCPHYDIPVPPCGVAIGSYNLPKLIDLQVKMVRANCGDVPILIVDDCSDGYGHTPGPETVCGQLRRIAANYPNVTLFVHPMRMGHASGDLSKVWMGLQWAKAIGVKILGTLSQRFLIDRPRWLQDGAKELIRSGLATASQPCREGRSVFPIRSEAMLLDVDRWHQPAILDHLMPRKMTPIPGEWGIAAEHVYADSIRDRLDGRFHHWSLFGSDRGIAYHGICWHCSHPPEAYAVLAKKYGAQLDEHFSTNGWRALQGKEYRG